ncbi:MAG TPA: enoyl-CoA hydratase/isomerase family protein [Chitinivibrionales bacterium]|jgi:enoyl-CoA hydratase/carnithine racemase|nr:enoyl-CoA hydratase/isomerase family protein [Chitinivibrionales bacterium]
MKLLYSIENSIGRIVLSNPPFNCLSEPEFERPGVLSEFLSSPELNAVMVMGGGRHFCAGASKEHLDEMARDEKLLKRNLDKGKALLDIIRYATVPVAAAIRGSCLGGGLEIALACHFRIAAAAAMFGFPESGRNLMPGLGGTVASQETTCRASLIDLAVSGRMIGAGEALSMGIIDKSCPPAAVEREARQFLERLTEGRRSSLIRKIMESIHNARRLSLAEALARETELFCEAAREANGNG